MLLAITGHSVCIAATPQAMPSRDDVGPRAMPHEIAPIDAPFPMPVMKRPECPQRTLVVTQCGGKPGLGHLSTEPIQRAVDETSAAGGGRVTIPAGKWLTGRIVLKTGVELHLERGAELHFSGRIEDYLPVVFCRCEGIEIIGLGGLIYAHEQDRIAVTGHGVLVGPETGPVREIRKGLSDQIVDPELPVEQRIFDGREGRHYFRPYFICPVGCTNVFVEGVTLRHGPMWNIVPIYCDRVVIRGVTVDSRGVGNGDGINIESSRNVLVEYCSVATGDDCYSLKAGRDEDGLRVGKPAESVVFRYNHADGGYGGVTFGSETAGGIRNVYVHDCLFEQVRHGVYFKTRRPRGGGGENILVERIVFSSSDHGLFFDMLGLPIYVGELAQRLPKREVTQQTPYYRKITLRNIQGRTDADAFKIKGIPESPASQITLESIDIQSRGLINLLDAREVDIKDSVFHSKSDTIRLVDAKGICFENVRFETPQSQVKLDQSGEATRDMVFEDCEPQPSKSTSAGFPPSRE